MLLWGGGVWGWLDPVTPMRARRAARPATHLVLLGLGRPGLEASGQAAAGEAAVAAARRAGLLGTRVHVNHGWVPYAERGAWLAEADLGVTAHRDHLEARYAHRTRLLDYLWAGLPVVATRGDALAELVERERLGATVAPGDVAGFADGVRAAARAGRRRRAGADRRASRRRCAGARWPRRSSRGATAPPPAAAASAAASCGARRSRSTAGRSAETLGERGPGAARAARRAPAAPGGAAAMRRLDRVELAVLVALAGFSLLVLAALLTKGRALTGADGLLASDQLQYFTWIRQAAEHGLVGNEYDMAPDHRVFLHPGFLLSGPAARGARASRVPLSYLLWKPVAVGLLFWGALRYVRRLLPPGGAAPRRADPRRCSR